MATSAAEILKLVEAELRELHEPRVVAYIRSLLVAPAAIARGWDYGAEGEAYPCWSVLEHVRSNTGIAYCEYGFGPAHPWGLVFLTGTEHMSMGMDSGWYSLFLEAFFQSQVATELPIWRVFQHTAENFPGKALTAEAAWEPTWAEVQRLRELYPLNRYHCNQSIYRNAP